MKGEQFALLVKNITRDGCLTSFPLVATVDGALTVVSGNNRVAAGIKAGIIEHDLIEITSPLTREQFVALQLSHNALVGEDDPNILKALYDELPFEWKLYSGLSDDAFKIEDLDLTALQVHAPFYQELHISFLPGDREVFLAWLESIGKSKAAAERMVGIYADFGQFFDMLLAVKSASGVHNTAVALRLMAEKAGLALQAEEAARAAAGEGSDAGS
jgi:hypothetical protein